MSEPEVQRGQMLEAWERSSVGWGRMADRVRDWGMPVSMWMVEHLDLQAGERVLELAAGPGDTGFLAAELIAPGGVLVSSDAAEGMLAVARDRAAALGVGNVEFKQLQLEWIDVETATVDAILCRWGVMLVVDPAAALGEMRRVLKPGGRGALAVWDRQEANPWATIPARALIELGLMPAPDPGAPGMFALAEPGRLREMLEDAGFVEVQIDAVDLERGGVNLEAYVDETAEMSGFFGAVWRELDEAGRAQVRERIRELSSGYAQADGSLRYPGRSLVALASA